MATIRIRNEEQNENKKDKRPQGIQLTCSPMHGQTERMERKKKIAAR